jgi:hypothetical protein
MTPLRLTVAAALVAWVGVGCLAPATPSRRVTDAARELNYAARFGRMDLAVARTADAARSHFLDRRAQWGRDVRVLDVQMTGLSLDDDGKKALVTVDVAWTRIDEGSLRSTQLAQVWKDQPGGWKLVRERRVQGDVGLFGEHVEVIKPPSPDVQFASKTIR